MATPSSAAPGRRSGRRKQQPRPLAPAIRPPGGATAGAEQPGGRAGSDKREGKEGGSGFRACPARSPCHIARPAVSVGCIHPSQEHWVPENLSSRRRDPWARQLRPSSRWRGSSRGAVPTTCVSCCDCSLACRSSPVEQPRGRAPQQLVYQEPETHGKGQPRSFRPLQSLLNSYHLQQVYALK